MSPRNILRLSGADISSRGPYHGPRKVNVPREALRSIYWLSITRLSVDGGGTLPIGVVAFMTFSFVKCRLRWVIRKGLLTRTCGWLRLRQRSIKIAAFIREVSRFVDAIWIMWELACSTGYNPFSVKQRLNRKHWKLPRYLRNSL